MLIGIKSAGKKLAKLLGYEIKRRSAVPAFLRGIEGEGQDVRTFIQTLQQKLRASEETLEGALLHPIGQITLAESRFLGEMVRGLTAPGPIVEIGTLYGWSTLVMTLYKSVERELITVDNYSWNPLGLSPDAHFRHTSNRLQRATEQHNVRIVRADKGSFYAGYKGPAPSLVFLDAIHTYEETKADIDWALKVGAGVICLHDYHSDGFPGVVRAVNESGGPNQLVESLVVLRKRTNWTARPAAQAA